MGRCRYAPAVLSPHRFAAVPPVHEPRAATPSATHTLMLLWKYLVNKITPEHIKCDWVRYYNVGRVACLVCIITTEGASCLSLHQRAHRFLCSHHDNDNPKRTKRSGWHSRGLWGIPSCFVPSGSRDKAQDTPLQCTLWQGSALCPFRDIHCYFRLVIPARPFRPDLPFLPCFLLVLPR